MLVLTNFNFGGSIPPYGQDEDLAVHVVVRLQRHVGREVQDGLAFIRAYPATKAELVDFGLEYSMYICKYTYIFKQVWRYQVIIVSLNMVSS